MKTKLYVCIKLVLLLTLMFLCNQFITAQQVPKSFTASNGTFIGFYEYKPANYNPNSTTKHPLIIFLHGIGERGDGTTELPYLTWHGLPKVISQGATMTFKNPTTGQQETFIVLSPQLPKWMGYWDNIYVDEMLKYAKSNLNIDTNKIYLTGLSLGGGGAWAYPNTSVEHAKQFAAIAPICGVCYYNYSTLCSTIGAAGLPVWGFTNADDNIVSPVCTTQACDLLSACSTAPSKIKKTVYPWGGHDSWTKAYDTGHTIQTDINLYEWFLSNTRASGNPAPNQPPVANAGAPVTITLPVNSANLVGNASTDADGSITSYSWSKVSGPAVFAITNPFSANTSVTNLIEGVYTFTLTVTDNSGATASSNVQVTVNPAPVPVNQAPVANAGSAIAVTLPTNTVNLNGTASNDPDGNIVSYSWTKISGPTSFNINSASASTTQVSNLVAGTYVFQLTVTDNGGATASSSVQVTVNPAVNQAPVADAGSTITITLPVNSVTLSGAASRDADGTITGYSWTKLSGPAAFVITNASASTTTVTGLVQGVYTFSLLVTDNQGATSSANVQVIVNAAPVPLNQAPVANAGTAITITLPTNSVTLNGAASSDADGTITNYNWSKLSGPASYSISNAGAATTAVNNLVEGVYTFQLVVTDNNGATATASVQVTVNAAPNQPPVANAGADQSLTYPAAIAYLDGSKSTDSDGQITSYSWILKSGNAGVTIAGATTARPSIQGLTAGIFVFELTVKDNSGAAATDQVTITVYKGNQKPKAHAGKDTSVSLPVSSIALYGNNSVDSDGSILSYTWRQVSGQPVSIHSKNSSSTTITGMTEGEYGFELSVLDNEGSVGSDTVFVAVVNKYRLGQYFVIYPNPVSDELHVRYIFSKTGDVHLNIYNGQGRIIRSYSYTKQTAVLEKIILLSDLKAGFYFLEVRFSDGKSAIKQFLKR